MLTAPVLTAPVLTAPVLTAPVVTAPVLTAPVHTAPVLTTRVLTALVLTAPALTAPVLTALAGGAGLKIRELEAVPRPTAADDWAALRLCVPALGTGKGTWWGRVKWNGVRLSGLDWAG